MKFSTLITAALPLLAVAAPSRAFDGDHHSDGQGAGIDAHRGDWAAQQGDTPNAHQPPKDLGPGAGDAHGEMTIGDHDQAHGEGLPDWLRKLKGRAIGPRDDVDHYIIECDSDADDRNCMQHIVVPKGKAKGGCTARVQKLKLTGFMHLADPHVMCKYFEDPGCKGRSSGPFSNRELDYSEASAHWNQIIYDPQSFDCQLVGFQPPNVPVQPPKAHPLPPPNWRPTMDYFLSKGLSVFQPGV